MKKQLRSPLNYSLAKESTAVNPLMFLAKNQQTLILRNKKAFLAKLPDIFPYQNVPLSAKDSNLLIP